MKTTIKFKLRPAGKEGDGIITVLVTRRRTTRSLSAGLRLKHSEWDPSRQQVVVGDARKQELTRIGKQIERIRVSILREVNRLSSKGDFTAGEVLASYRSRSRDNTFGRYLNQKVAELERAGHYGNARCYRSAFNSFKTFCKGRDVPLKEITATLIGAYEKHLFAKGNARNTVSCYLRSLRAVYNRAAAEGLAPALKSHPFAGVYTGNARTEKRSVSKTEITAVAQKELPGEKNEKLRLSRDLFLFSFYTQGMSYVDMIHLTQENLQGEYLVYRRRKTGQEIRIRLLPCIWGIIRRYAGDARQKRLFPVLTGPAEGKAGWKEYLNGLARYNRGLKRLSALLGFNTRLTGYVARHTWATCAAGEGISLSTISRGMGHGSEKTTRIYIGTLDNSDVNRANQQVLSFLTNQMQQGATV